MPKIEVTPGAHKINAVCTAGIIDRVTDFNIKPGEVQTYQIRFEAGVWVMSCYADYEAPKSSYEVRI